jgi:hypothetical protein
MRGLSMLSAIAVLCFCFNALGGAKEHFINGQEYYEQGQYKDAIDEFEKAYSLDARPKLLFNIAQSYEKLGNLKKSVDYFKRYVKAESDKVDTTSIKNKITNLEARIKQTGIAVTVSEEGADIYVDGEKMAASPVNGVLALDEGMHKIRIVKEGFKDFTMNVGVSTGHSVPVDATLEKADASYVPVSPIEDKKVEAEPVEETPPEQPEPAASEPAEETPAETNAVDDIEATEETSDDKGIEVLDIVPWAVAGVGGITAAVGWGVLGSQANSEGDTHKAMIADIVGGVGVAVAVGGAVWGIVRLIKKKKGKGADTSSVSAMPLVTADQAGMAASFSF